MSVARRPSLLWIGARYRVGSIRRLRSLKPPCPVAATPCLGVEEYATGSSGLQNLGSGYYQFNWQTPKSYAKSCKTVSVSLDAGGSLMADFRFTR